jgi:hypothetical protein
MGVRFVPRPVLSRQDARAVREVGGVPTDLIEAFSSRRARNRLLQDRPARPIATCAC